MFDSGKCRNVEASLGIGSVRVLTMLSRSLDSEGLVKGWDIEELGRFSYTYSYLYVRTVTYL